MKKGIFVGDSHLALMDKAFRESDGWGVDVDFVCAPNPVTSRLSLKHRRMSLEPWNKEMYVNHPLAGSHDFDGWHADVEKAILDISGNGEINLEQYDFFVLVSCQIMNLEIWGPTVTSSERGEISTACEVAFHEGTFNLDHGGNHSRHFSLLSGIDVACPVFSVATPLKSEASDLAKNLAVQMDGGKRGLYKRVEQIYGERINRAFKSRLLSYPDELVTKSGIATLRKYQRHSGDLTHLNADGSEVLMRHLISQIRDA